MNKHEELNVRIYQIKAIVEVIEARLAEIHILLDRMEEIKADSQPDPATQSRLSL